jgi:hypothetical protein
VPSGLMPNLSIRSASSRQPRCRSKKHLPRASGNARPAAIVAQLRVTTALLGPPTTATGRTLADVYAEHDPVVAPSSPQRRRHRLRRRRAPPGRRDRLGPLSAGQIRLVRRRARYGFGVGGVRRCLGRRAGESAGGRRKSSRTAGRRRSLHRIRWAVRRRPVISAYQPTSAGRTPTWSTVAGILPGHLPVHDRRPLLKRCTRQLPEVGVAFSPTNPGSADVRRRSDGISRAAVARTTAVGC